MAEPAPVDAEVEALRDALLDLRAADAHLHCVGVKLYGTQFSGVRDAIRGAVAVMDRLTASQAEVARGPGFRIKISGQFDLSSDADRQSVIDILNLKLNLRRARNLGGKP